VAKIPYTVVIPAYNESQSIRKVIAELRLFSPEAEIIVVDDCSSTPDAVREFAGVRLIRHPVNRGAMAAVMTGLKAAAREVVVTMDADGQHPARLVPEIAGLVEEDRADIALGVRPDLPRWGERLIAWSAGVLRRHHGLSRPQAQPGGFACRRPRLWRNVYRESEKTGPTDLRIPHSDLPPGGGQIFSLQPAGADQIPMVSFLGIEIFEKVPAVSIDYGIMEKSQRVAVLPLAVKWSDLGSFDAFFDEFPRDEKGNVVFNGGGLCDAAGNLLYTDKGKVAALVGVRDLIVVDEPDALLICPKDQAQRVKEVVARLKATGNPRTDFHLTTSRPFRLLHHFGGGLLLQD